MQLTTYPNRLMCTASGLTRARMLTRRTTEARKSAKLATEALNSANTVTLRRVLCVAKQLSCYL